MNDTNRNKNLLTINEHMIIHEDPDVLKTTNEIKTVMFWKSWKCYLSIQNVANKYCKYFFYPDKCNF